MLESSRPHCFFVGMILACFQPRLVSGLLSTQELAWTRDPSVGESSQSVLSEGRRKGMRDFSDVAIANLAHMAVELENKLRLFSLYCLCLILGA